MTNKITILITRHGFRANWEDPKDTTSPTGINSDPTLSRHGVDQSRELAAYLSNHESDITHIYSSPFYRCVQTAVPTAQSLNLPIFPENGIGEWFRRERHKIPIPASPIELKQWFPEVDEYYKSIQSVSARGESIHDIHVRCEKFVEALRKKMNRLEEDESHRQEPNNKNGNIKILLVTHAASKIALGRALTKDPNADIRTGTCSVDKYELNEEDGSWECIENGRTDFLSKGEEMHWTFDSAYMPGSTEEAEARLKGKKNADNKTEQENADQSGEQKEGLLDTDIGYHMNDNSMDLDGPTQADSQKREKQKESENQKKEEDEFVDVYVPLDMSLIPQNNMSLVDKPLQIVGLHENRPIIRIGDQYFQGKWQDMVGTEVYMKDGGDGTSRSETISPFATARQRIILQSIQLHSKSREGEGDADKKESLRVRMHKLTELRRQMEQGGQQASQQSAENAQAIGIEEHNQTDGNAEVIGLTTQQAKGEPDESSQGQQPDTQENGNQAARATTADHVNKPNTNP